MVNGRTKQTVILLWVSSSSSNGFPALLPRGNCWLVLAFSSRHGRAGGDPLHPGCCCFLRRHLHQRVCPESSRPATACRDSVQDGCSRTFTGSSMSTSSTRLPTAPAGCSFLTVEWLKEMGWTTWFMPWEGWNNTHGERTLKNSALKDGLCFREWNLPAREPLQVTSITEVGKYHAASLDNRICLGEGICVQADEDHGCYSGYISSGSNWKMNPRNQCTK